VKAAACFRYRVTALGGTVSPRDRDFEENSLLLVGFLSLFQISFLPGYLALRGMRVRCAGALEAAIYAFGLSLILNHTLVYALHSAGAYTSGAIYTLVSLECVAFAALLIRKGFWTSWRIPPENILARLRALRKDRPALGPAAVFLAVVAILCGAGLFFWNFGSVFVMNDDVVSWDRWAAEWTGPGPVGAGLYPQLLPANWSITYMLLGSTDVKMFAKAIMPLFPLATLLLFIDLFLRRGGIDWLLGAGCYAFLLSYFFSPELLTAGYADVASAFFALLTLHAMTGAGSKPFGPPLAIVFASGCMLTKQGGAYIFVIATGWLIARFVRSKERNWRAAVAVVLLALAINARWVVVEWQVLSGRMGTNLSTLTHDLHGGRDYPERWSAAWLMIRGLRGRTGDPEEASGRIADARADHGDRLVHLGAVLILLGVFHTRGRLALLLFAPYYVFWALFFSYEVRTLALGLPFAAHAMACGLDTAASWVRRASGMLPRWSPGANAQAAAAIVLAAWALLNLAPMLGAERIAGWRWMLIGLAAAVLASIRGGSLQPIALRVPLPAILIAGIGAVGAAQAMMWPSAAIVDRQLALRREAGVAPLNRRLYECQRRGFLKGLIETDYHHLEFLPGLGSHHRVGQFAGGISTNYLEKLLSDESCSHVFTLASRFPDTVRDWMARLGFRTVFEAEGWVLIALPDQRPAGPRIFAAGLNPPRNRTFTGWLIGAGFRDGDLLLVDDKEMYRTVFDHEGAITFELPESLLARGFTAQVMRPATGERSGPYTVAPR
jgi:hypothetical protein